MSTVVPTSFTGVDSFDKTRFMYIAGNLSILLRETESVGRRDVLQFHLIESDIVYEFFVGKIRERVRR